MVKYSKRRGFVGGTYLYPTELSRPLSTLPEIHVRTRLRHPRLKYVLRVVGEDLGYRFRFYNESRLSAGTQPDYLITYGGPPDPYRLPAHPLLAGKPHAAGADDVIRDADDLPHYCQTSDGPDLLAAIFFCLSRYEEYAASERDAHGRYPAAVSHALRHGYLHRPVVREWTALLGHRLRTWFPQLPPPRKRTLDFHPTYDIDILYAYRYRGWRGHASAVRDVLTGHPGRARARYRTKRDPYDTLEELEDLHRYFRLRPTYYWLLSDRTHPHDPNPYPVPAEQKEWMRRLARTADMGIHPSYRSSDVEALFATEKHELEQILGVPVARSRQHYLRFRLPSTYRALLRAGLRSDASMGYGDVVGWRAGTNLPFAWYDLEMEQETRLIIHPFAAMDVTLRNYLGLSAQAAARKVTDLAHAVRPYGGPFPLLWHNSSFADDYGWAGWWTAYRDLVASLTALQTSPTP